MKTVIVTGTTKSPITLEEIKDHLRIERGETFYDDSLKGMRSAAIEMAENITGRKLMPQTWQVSRSVTESALAQVWEPASAQASELGRPCCSLRCRC